MFILVSSYTSGSFGMMTAISVVSYGNGEPDGECMHLSPSSSDDAF
jgi:hypothetical protein